MDGEAPADGEEEAAVPENVSTETFILKAPVTLVFLFLAAAIG